MSMSCTLQCWTDHKLLRAKLWLQVPPKGRREKIRQRFSVAGLRKVDTRKKYSKLVMDVVQERWSESSGKGK